MAALPEHAGAIRHGSHIAHIPPAYRAYRLPAYAAAALVWCGGGRRAPRSRTGSALAFPPALTLHARSTPPHHTLDYFGLPFYRTPTPLGLTRNTGRLYSTAYLPPFWISIAARYVYFAQTAAHAGRRLSSTIRFFWFDFAAPCNTGTLLSVLSFHHSYLNTFFFFFVLSLILTLVSAMPIQHTHAMHIHMRIYLPLPSFYRFGFVT